MTEEWRPLPGEEGRYEVSNLGRVRSWVKQGGRVRDEPFYLKEHIRKTGHGEYAIGGSSGKKVMTGRAVLLAFAGPPPTDQHQAAHNDGNPRNNAITNLRWATPEENMRDKYGHGTMPFGTKHTNSKLSAEDVYAIRKVCGFASRNALAKCFGVSPATIAGIVSGKRYVND